MYMYPGTVPATTMRSSRNRSTLNNNILPMNWTQDWSAWSLEGASGRLRQYREFVRRRGTVWRLWAPRSVTTPRYCWAVAASGASLLLGKGGGGG